MNEKEMGRQLLRGEDPVDSRTLTDRVLQRDRRRMWFLGVTCIVAWMLVVMLPWATILPMIAQVADSQAGISHNATTASPEQREASRLVFQVVKQGTIATFICSVASMFVAAICTVLLII